MKVSVIMPVYNSEAYLEMAAGSVLSQSEQDIELIMVDDGATDASGRVCDRIAATDRRVKVIHQANAGISAARNTGIKAAVGDYIAFIDNDDTYVDGFLEQVHTYAVEHNADVVKFGYRVIEDWHESTAQARPMAFTQNAKVSYSDIGDQYAKLKKEGFFNMIWNGLYKREFVERCRLLFDEEVKKGYEDWIYNYKLFGLTEDCYTWKKIEYNHFQRGSHSTSSNYHQNQQMALIRAAEMEFQLVQKLNRTYRAGIDWDIYAMNYFIEALLMFERKNCVVKQGEKLAYIKKLYALPLFDMLSSVETRKKFPLTKRTISRLLAGRHFRLLLVMTRLYNHILIRKRKQAKYN